MNSVIPWIRAARLQTLPLAASCVLIGGALSLASGLDSDAMDRFPWVFGGALLTVVLLQVLSNFANDYGDFRWYFRWVVTQWKIFLERENQHKNLETRIPKLVVVWCNRSGET